MGWYSANSNVISIDDAAGITRNVISEYGQLTKSEITSGCSCINGNTCRVQHNMQFYHFLKSSLSKEGHLKIISKSNKYHIAGVPCTALLWKLLMQKSVIENRATTTQYRTNLSSLDVYMATVNLDI